MRTTVTAITISLILAACANKKPAEEPENTEDTASSDDSSKSTGENTTGESESTLGGSTGGGGNNSSFMMGRPADKATIKDDTEKQAAPCDGSKIPDLLASISQAACTLPEGASPATQQVKKDNLDVTLSAAAQVHPGSTAQVSVVFKNKGKTKLPLDFTVDPDPRFRFEVFTPKGARVDKPAGNEPPLPPDASGGITARLARVTLDPNGTATLLLPWQAVKYKWAPKEKAKGAFVGHGYPREPAGPLPKGKYVLRLVMPIANVDETGDHEVTQPRADVEIAGAVEAPPPPAPAETPKAAPPPAASAPAPAASASEAAVESKFLKTVGASSASASASASPPAKPPKKKH